jgi:hypothetical protein
LLPTAAAAAAAVSLSTQKQKKNTHPTFFHDLTTLNKMY